MKLHASLGFDINDVETGISAVNATEIDSMGLRRYKQNY
jgi:hypothetical protein